MIQKTIELSATPAQVWKLLTTSAEFSELTGGAPTKISAQPGEVFSLFGGMIVGRNVECTSQQRLVQAWRPKTWEPGVYSLVKFELAQNGDKTQVQLTHTGYPEDQKDHLSGGWDQNYLEPMEKRFS